MNKGGNFPFGNNDFFNRMGAFNYMPNDNFNTQNSYPNQGYENYSMSNRGGNVTGTRMGNGQGKRTSIKKTTQYM
jgi:hypothetical protein